VKAIGLANSTHPLACRRNVLQSGGTHSWNQRSTDPVGANQTQSQAMARSGPDVCRARGEADRALGLALFAAVALTPSCTPLVVELIRPGGSASIRASCEAFMKTNGRWIAALILLGAGAFVAWNAAHSMP